MNSNNQFSISAHASLYSPNHFRFQKEDQIVDNEVFEDHHQNRIGSTQDFDDLPFDDDRYEDEVWLRAYLGELFWF